MSSYFASNIWQLGLFVMAFLIARYTIIAGAAWLVWYKINREKWAYKKIQPRFPLKKDYLREIGFSLGTFIVFALMIMIVFSEPVKPYTWMYRDISEYGWVYFVFSIFVMLVLHDTYFYWTHRIMHHPVLFNTMHLVHHRSVNPTPWASFSFHPTESLIEFSVLLIFIFGFPTHRLAIMTFLLLMTVINVYGHLGFELFPKGFNKHFIGKWINTSVSHNMHHRYFKGNYSLYFTWWDRWMGTLHPEYDKQFDEAVSKSKPVEASV